VRRPSGVAVASIMVLLGLWVPLGLVVANSLNADELLVGWGGFTTQWYGEALSDSRVRSSFVTSLEVAAVSTALAVAIALTASMWARRASRRGRGMLDASTYMRIILPETVIAIGLFLLLRRFDVALGLATVVIGHVVFNSAYATIVLQARFATMTPDLEEAAADLGATPWRTFRRVTLPSILPALIVASLLVFTFSLDNVVTSLFLGGTDTETLPVLLLGKIRIRVTPEVNAIGVLVMLATTALLAIAAVILGLRSAAGSGQRARSAEQAAS
jgi:ABC-type spermidine/putrescine transport system permease subunit II